MSKAGRFAGFDLVHLLLIVTTAELAFNRLATRELRPAAEVPPWWHQVLDHFGLFCQYFASTLAVGIIVHQLWRLIRLRDLYWSVSRWGLVVAGVAFLCLAGVSLGTAPGPELSFWLETCFVAVVLFLVLGQVVRGGDLGAKTGLLILAVPLAVHYYGPLSLRVLSGEEARWSDLPERIQLFGQWTAVVAAMVSPYCFAPRPFFRSAARLGPLAVASFVGIIGALIVRQQYEVGMRLAYQGLGIDIGPDAPGRFLAFYLVALATITWTLASCLTADAVSRRDIGVGLGLVVVGGYGFAWPLQYLVSLVGLMTISRAAASVAAEERDARDPAPSFRVPPIAEPVWERFVRRLSAALSVADRVPAVPASASQSPDDASNAPGDGSAKVSSVVIKHDDEHSVTHVVTRRRGLDIDIRVDRVRDSVVALDILCGREPDDGAEPVWTMYARPERVLGIGAHPEPPRTSAPVRTIDDPPFVERFRVRDADRYSEALLDGGLRARAIALLDGWVALWAERGLRYRVHPGMGAPLDHPIPISDLAFRGVNATIEVERLVAIVDLLATMASRVLVADDEDTAAVLPGAESARSDDVDAGNGEGAASKGEEATGEGEEAAGEGEDQDRAG